MTHLPNLILDLGLILMAAAVVTLLFKKLKQPVVLGYLIAGFLVGPHFSLLPSIQDTESISIWAEIGVIFMLFGLGLEFSFKKLTKVGKSASITASFEILTMLGIGYLLGRLLNWSSMDSLFLGGILSISSTTIIVRAFHELGLKGRGFVSLVFGVLIVEDLLAILLLVLLTSVAATRTLSGSALLGSSLKLAFFLVLWFLLGIYLLPEIFRRLKGLFLDETLLIVSLGLCLMMVVIANTAGFSPALGAFVMGSLLAETSKGPKIEHMILPVKDLFSAIFFVSVGMLIDPQVLKDHFGVILLITAVTIVGKFTSTSIGALISGVNLKRSVQSGMSLAQIGEFSFIIATLGMTLKVTSGFLYPIAVAVSACTTFTTPYLIKVSDRFALWLDGKMPNPVKASLRRYESALLTSSGTSILSLVWKEYGIKILLNSVIVVGITLAVQKLALPYFGETFSTLPVHLLACVLALILSAPFLWAIFFGRPLRSITYKPEITIQLSRLQIGIVITRLMIGGGIVGFVVSHFTSMLAASGILIVILSAMGVFFFGRFSQIIYTKIENRFISNLTANERAEMERTSQIPDLAPWSATLAEFIVTPHSPLILQSLQNSKIKENFGVTIAMIERGAKRIMAPTRDDVLLPSDKLFLIGTDEQLSAVRSLIELSPTVELPPIEENFGLESFTLGAKSSFANKTIRSCGIRERVNGLIVGVERQGERHLNPDSSMELLPGDLVWLVGSKKRIKALRMRNV